MILDLYLPPLLLVFVPAFTLGFLHTIIPCEDKAIFIFWSLGISKTPQKSVLILILYGLGLMSANLIIACGTVLISFIPQIFLPQIIPDDPYAINFFGAVSSMFAGVILLFFIMMRGYIPHSKQKEELSQLNWEKKKTPYLFGILAGFPPCIFELLIYSWCLQWSLQGGLGFIDGIFTVFYFSLGTFVGLFPLAIAKQSTSQFMKTSNNKKKHLVLIIMIFIVIIFNLIVMILSFLSIPVFPKVPS